MTTMFAFSITKGILTYKGLSTMSTTLDWISGGVLVVVLYWIGLYEARDSTKWKWFFQVDLTSKIGYGSKRVVGEAKASEDHNSSNISESTPPVTPSLDATDDLAATRSGPEVCPEGRGDERPADSDAKPPPLGVKLTAYRLLNVTIMFVFPITKGILTYKGLSTMPTTLDWISGGVLAVVLYWIGLYEERDSTKWKWLLHVDLAPAIGYGAKRVIGEILWPLFFFDGLIVIFSLGNFLGNLAVLLIVLSIPHLPQYSLWGIFIGIFVRFIRARVPGGQSAIVSFVNTYGPSLPREKYGLRKVLRIFCGVAALVALSMVVYHYLVWRPLCTGPVATFHMCFDICQIQEGKEEGDCVALWCGDYVGMGVMEQCLRTPIHQLIRWQQHVTISILDDIPEGLISRKIRFLKKSLPPSTVPHH
ncbi:hypothetical protein V8E53_006206 [Lactarius tabidus]